MIRKKTYISRRNRPLVIGLAALLTAGNATAELFPLGVNFSEEATQDLTPEEIAGAPGFEQTNWNNLGRWGNPTPLADNTGTATEVNVKWDATGTWRTNADATLGGNHKLMKGYLDSNGAANTSTFDGVFGTSDDKPLILVTGLNAWMTAKGITSYSVVIYSDSDVASGQRGAKAWLTTADTATSANGDPGLGGDLTGQVEMLDGANWGDSPAFVKVSGTSGVGNYTVFNSVKADAFYIRLDEGGPAPWRAPINGFQIIGTDVAEVADADGDGLPDAWESNFGLDPNDDGTTLAANGASGDPDVDGRTNLQEFTDGTNPVKADSDSDGLNDGEEFAAGTNPLDPDTDNDELPDGWEAQYDLDPLDDGTIDINNGVYGDPDNDFLINIDEFTRKTNPQDPDTDKDGYSDSAEDLSGAWFDENYTGTNPTNPDTDGDGIPDGAENPTAAWAAGSISGTDPNLPDTDGDGTSDRWEFLLGTNPKDPASNLASIPLVNGSFEQPDTAGTYLNLIPDGWSMTTDPGAEGVFEETLANAGMTGGDQIQYAGLQQIGAYFYQDTGVQFSPSTTYIIELSAGYRAGFAVGRMEFGVASSAAPTVPLPSYPGWATADSRIGTNVLRPVSSIATLAEGAMGQNFSLVTGATAPTSNLVVYIRHVNGFRVMFDNIRIIAIPNSVDNDQDGLPDGWELANGLSPSDSTGLNGASGDLDADGRTNAQELAAGTNPRNTDTDGDGLSDQDEATAGTDPLTPNDPPQTVSTLAISSAGFNDSAFEISATGMVVEKFYRLTRSEDLVTFEPIGTAVTGVTNHVFIDAEPPVGKAFYRIEEDSQ